MWSITLLLGLSGMPVMGVLASLGDVCTTGFVKSSLPAAGFLQGVDLVADSVTANAVTNYTVVGGSTNVGVKGRDFCNVTFAYSHTGRNDKVNLWFWLPSPEQFQNRFLATGGGGLAITSGQRGLQAGLPYGAATGTTDGGFGSWQNDLSSVLLRADGSLNYDMLNSYGFTSIHEMTVLGKELTRKFYGSPSKMYSYYQGCSEGGREGWSQVQRYPADVDGAAIGAPAFRQAFLQVAHLFPPTVENTLHYYPSSCELDRINTDAIAACDALDGKADGVVSRSDLCKLHYNATASIGKAYNCSASSGGFGFGAPPRKRQFGGPPSPAASGIVTAQAAAVANEIWRGLFDSKGRQVYISFNPTVSFSDAATSFNAATGRYEAVASGLGLEYVNLFLKEIKSSTLSLQNVTYDTLRDWMLEGMQKFSNTLQTTWPDLEEFRDRGGKVIHWHGEADNAIPTSSSVIYHDAVRRSMYPDLGFNESQAELGKFYRFFMVPGAGHCSPSAQQPNGPFPTDVLQNVIDWVEKGVTPEQLPATVQGGPSKGAQQNLCSWPLRPTWSGGNMDCVFDQQSFDTWLPKLDSIPVPVY